MLEEGEGAGINSPKQLTDGDSLSSGSSLKTFYRRRDNGTSVTAFASWCKKKRGGSATPFECSFQLELEAHRDLTGAATAEVGASGRGDDAELRAGEIQPRIIQVGVVQDIGEGSFRAQPDALGKDERLAEAARKIDRARPFDVPDLRVAEAANRSECPRLAGTDVAGLTECPVRLARAGEGRPVDPIVATLAPGGGAADAVGLLGAAGIGSAGCAVVKARTGAGGIDAASREIGGEERTTLPEEDIA